MHLDDSESEQLKGWIVKRLEDISDADSDVLADYVLALLKSDEGDDQVRRNCHENLDDFLKEHTAAFVDDVFGAIATKSFDPSRPQQAPSTPAAQAFNPAAQSFNPAAQAFNPVAQAFNPPTGPASNDRGQQSRKRGFNDFDGAEGQNGFGQNGRDRPMKQMRRGGRGGFEQRGGRAGMGMSHLPQLPTPPPGMPAFDPNNPLATLMAMQAMGMPALPGMPTLPFDPSSSGFPQQSSLPPKRPGERCKDYDTKGFCALGASCPYEHGNDHFVVPKQEEYDPANSSLSGSAGQESRGYNDRGRGRGRGRGDRGGRGGRGGRADFSMTGPNHDPSNTSIVVEHIPEEKFEEQAVRDYFSEFGNIEDINLQPYKRIAVIKYSEKASAQSARDSRKAIFDDRFVKVYWYNPDKMPRQHDGQRNGRNKHSADEDVEMQEEEEKIDPVELAKKQEEAQKAHEEKMQKMKEAEAAREELEKKVRAQAEERNKLMAKLAAKERAKSGTPDQAMNGAADATKTTSQTDALKAKLAELEKEAESMGINPNEDAQPWQGFAPRGRGGYRGRGAFVPRGAAAWRGRGGFNPRGGAVMRLDNRPRNVAVVFPSGEEMGPDKDEALRQYLLFNDMMESATVTTHPDRKDAALLAFKERYLAEKFIGQAKEIPHIGKVELSWVANSNTPAVVSTPTTTFTAGGNGGNGVGNGGSGSGDVKMDEAADMGQRGEVDYDVADDDDRWLVG